MEVRERLRFTKRSLVPLAILAIISTMSSDNPDRLTAHKNQANVENVSPNRESKSGQAAKNTPKLPSETTTTISNQSLPNPNSRLSTPTTTVEESAQTKVNIIIRNWVAKSLRHSSAKKLVPLHVSPGLQAMYSSGLFVLVPKTDCAAITEFNGQDGKIQVQNRLFGRPNNLSDPNKLEADAYAGSGLIGHGDTDAAAALGRNPVEYAKPNISSVSQAILSITTNVCSQLPPALPHK